MRDVSRCEALRLSARMTGRTGAQDIDGAGDTFALRFYEQLVRLDLWWSVVRGPWSVLRPPTHFEQC